MANNYRTRRGSTARAHQGMIDLFSGVTPLDKKCRLKSAPGMSQGRRSKLSASDYGVQLQMKQLIRRTYGVIEKQFRGYYEHASRSQGNTADNLMVLLESRLDNVVYRLGFASTRREARQMVSHGHVLVGGRRVTIPSYQVKKDDVVSLSDKAKETKRVGLALDLASQRETMPWLNTDTEKLSGTMVEAPMPDHLDANFNPNLVIEFYSK